MNTMISKLPLITLSCFIFLPSIHTAASSPIKTHPWKTSRFDTSPCSHPLIQLSADLFAVGRHNELVATAYKTGERAILETGTSIIAKHPNYLTNRATRDAEKVPRPTSKEYLGYSVTATDPNKKCLTAEDLLANTILTPASTEHQSPIFCCARFENTIASVSPWYILLTHLNTQRAPEIIEHRSPRLFTLDRKKLNAEQGRYGSDNWMQCIAIHKNMLATGQFDGSIFLWDLKPDGKKEPLIFLPRINDYRESRTVKQIQFTADGKKIFALNRHGLTIILQHSKRGFREKPKESAHFESMLFDEEHNTIYVGTANGSIYGYRLKENRVEFLTDLSGFSCPDKKINVIKKIGAMLCLGTNGGNVYTHDINRHPCTQKIVDGDTSPICDLLPIGTRELIISRQNGTLERILLSAVRPRSTSGCG